MIPADVLTTHFGIHHPAQLKRRSSDAVIKLVLRCCVYWPNRLGLRQKVLKPLKTFMLLLWWCPLGQGKGHLPAMQFILAVRLIPILTHLNSRWTVPLRCKYEDLAEKTSLCPAGKNPPNPCAGQKYSEFHNMRKYLLYFTIIYWRNTIPLQQYNDDIQFLDNFYKNHNSWRSRC
jgi:hypothetical protein